MGDGTFNPSGTIKRGEFLKLVMTSCMPKGGSIDEIPKEMNHWASGYVTLAELYGVIEKGTITINNIEEPITRIEMVRMITKADIIMEGNGQQFGEKVIFKDIGTMDRDSLYLLRHAVSRGFITGYDDGTFGPERTMTRAEAATIIYRFTR